MSRLISLLGLLVALAGIGLLVGQVVAVHSPIVPGTPVANPGAGSYSSTQSVTLASPLSTSIYYTVDGSTPSCAGTGTSALYSTAISVAATETIKALGCVGAYQPGGVLSAAYTIASGWTLCAHTTYQGNGTHTTTTINAACGSFVTLEVVNQLSTFSFTDSQSNPQCGSSGQVTGCWYYISPAGHDPPTNDIYALIYGCVGCSLSGSFSITYTSTAYPTIFVNSFSGTLVGNFWNTYTGLTTYGQYDFMSYPYASPTGGVLYESLIASNTGHEPDISPSQWQVAGSETGTAPSSTNPVTIQPGSITTVNANSLAINLVGCTSSNVTTCSTATDAAYTLVDNYVGTAGTSYGGAVSYKNIAAGGTATNPQATVTYGSTPPTAAVASVNVFVH